MDSLLPGEPRDGTGPGEGSLRSWTFPDSAQCRKALGLEDPASDGAIDRVYSLEHRVAVGDGRTLAITEYFTIASWLRGPRRAVLLLQGPVFRRNSWNIPVEGYDGAARAARRGLFVFTVDYLGVGDSSRPEDGREAGIEENAVALDIVLEQIRSQRAVDKVAVVGEGSGGILAARLAADAERVSACVLAAMLYKHPIGGPSQDPEFVAMLTGSPNGYFSIPPMAYEPFLGEARPGVREYFLETQPGEYPTAAMLVVAEGEPPFFDPGPARAPGLVIFGDRDFVVGPRDPHELAADYGTSGAELVTSEAAGHSPRIESPDVVDWFWSQVFDFIDPRESR